MSIQDENVAICVLLRVRKFLYFGNYACVKDLTNIISVAEKENLLDWQSRGRRMPVFTAALLLSDLA